MVKGRSGPGSVAGAVANAVYNNRAKIRQALGKNAPKEKNSTLNLKMGRPLKGRVEKRKANHKKRPAKGKGTKNANVETGEQSFYSKVDGKPVKKTLANVYKILSANTCRNWYEFNGAGALWGAAGAGYYTLGNIQSAAGSALSAPLYLFDLSAVNNWVQGASYAPTVGWRYYPTNETSSATPNFSTQSYTMPISLVNTQGSTSEKDAYPGGEDMHVSTQIKMNIVGSLQVPQNVDVMLIKFKKDYLCPDIVNMMGSASSSEAGTSYLSEAKAFYDSLLKPKVSNPILVQDQKHLKDIKVLKHDKFHFEPRLNTELPSTDNATGVNIQWPHVKTVSYFERFNKKCDYKWSDLGDVALNNSIATQMDTGDVRPTVAPKDRIYLLVMGEAFQTFPQFYPAVNASFDLMVKHKHERIL
jgi:hypothetical protein